MKSLKELWYEVGKRSFITKRDDGLVFIVETMIINSLGETTAVGYGCFKGKEYTHLGTTLAVYVLAEDDTLAEDLGFTGYWFWK